MKPGILRIHFMAVAVLTGLLFASCSKTVDHAAAIVPREIAGFHISESRLILLTGNAANKAVTFSWAVSRPGDIYTIEADVSADFFSDPVEIISTKANNASFAVADFNKLMSTLLYAGCTGKVDFRVRVDHDGSPAIYSSPTAMVVTTYRNYISYEESNTIKVPGNYQGWNVATAPKIVAAQVKGEYEGFLNLVNPSPQVLLVKGNEWSYNNTFTYIGADMFGFGGSIMTISGGSGVYLFKANTNTNKWATVKINNWAIAGNAVNPASQTVMAYDEEQKLSWNVTTDLLKGSFRIRANNTNSISFGKKAVDEPGVPSYNGEDFIIKQPGNYTVTLTLNMAGNYAYSIHRNS